LATTFLAAFLAALAPPRFFAALAGLDFRAAFFAALFRFAIRLVSP
jgi:hypothetical protein